MRVIVAFLLAAKASAFGPNGPCFVKEVWKESDVQEFDSIVFGSAVDHPTGKTLTLTLDAYLPPASDNRTARPLAVLVHGGSFISGNSQSDGEPLLARKLAARGYVAVSINYRLDANTYGLQNDRRAILAAVDDTKAAIRYARSVASEYNLDPTRVAVMGDSAGAITSLYVGYATAGRHGDSKPTGEDDSVQAVVPISGSMKDQGFCQGLYPNGQPYNCQINGTFDDYKNVTGSPQPPLLMVHGTEDCTVPYVDGKEVADRAAAVGLASKLITIKGGYHVPFDQLWGSAAFTNEFFTFLAENFAKGAECPTL